MMALTMPRKAAGKPQNFTPEQNEALRKALLEFKERNELNQEQLGGKLGVEQQNAGRLLSVKGSGFSYQTGTRAARLLGYIGVDAFFEAQGVGLDRRAADPDPTTNSTQADGMRSARAVGISEKAIQLVNRRHAESGFHTSRWWCTQYIAQQDALDEARRELEPKQAPVAPRSKRAVANE